jgi:hypothetical protein
LILGAVIPAGLVLGLVSAGLAMRRPAVASGLYFAAVLICVLDVLAVRSAAPDAVIAFYLLIAAPILIVAAAVALLGTRRSCSNTVQ